MTRNFNWMCVLNLCDFSKSTHSPTPTKIHLPKISNFGLFLDEFGEGEGGVQSLSTQRVFNFSRRDLSRTVEYKALPVEGHS